MTTRRRHSLALAMTLALVIAPSALAPVAAQSPSAVPECGAPSADGAYPGWPSSSQASSTGALLPIVISSQVVAGAPTRFLYSIADPANPYVPTASSDVTTQVAFFALARDPATAVSTVPGTFLDSGNGLGLYHL